MAPPANASIKPRRGLNIETKPRPKSAAIGSTNPVRADIIIASFLNIQRLLMKVQLQDLLEDFELL